MKNQAKKVKPKKKTKRFSWSIPAKRGREELAVAGNCNCK